MHSRQHKCLVNPFVFFRIFRKKKVPAEAVEFSYAIEVAILWNV